MAIFHDLPILSAMILCACGGRARDGEVGPPAAAAAPPAGAGQAVTPPARASGELEIAFALPAADAVLIGGRVVALDPGMKSVSAHATEDGRLLWRTAVQEEPSGMQRLRVQRAAVLFWGGDHITRLDPLTGARTSMEEAPRHDECSLVEKGGVCAYACPCSMQLADCETGRRIGEEHRKTYTEMFGGRGEPPHAGCFGSGVGLLAGAGPMAVVMVEDPAGQLRGHFQRDLLVLGVAAATGRVVWRSSELVPGGGVHESGASPDGRTCWVASEYGDLRVFHCATGAVLWRRAGAGGAEGTPRHFVSWHDDAGALFRLTDRAAALHEPRAGAPKWEVAVPPGSFAIPVGARIGLYDISADHGDLALLLLSPRDGGVAGRVRVPEDAVVYRDPSGGFYVYATGGELAAHDADGRERGRVRPPISPPNPVVGEDFFALSDAERMILVDRRDARVAGEVTGLLDVHAGSSLAGGLLLQRHVDGGKRAGEALYLRRRPATQSVAAPRVQ